MSEKELTEVVDGCDVVVSCLGHVLSFSGVYGHPRRLVADTLRRICGIIQKSQSDSNRSNQPTKIILMGSNGVANPKGTDDLRSFKDRMLLSAIRFLLPPHVDNEEAAFYLSEVVGYTDHRLAWVVVRPDNLIEGEVSGYEVLEKPKSSGLFGEGQMTRANVAHFMGELILCEETWTKWVYKMPVVCNV